MTTALNDWARGGYARDRWDVVATAKHRTIGGTHPCIVSVALTRLPSGERGGATVRWEKARPVAGAKISRVWRHVDRDGGRWSIELGYDGHWWVLFGPEGIPFGDESLASRRDEALEIASAWIATQRSPLRDLTATDSGSNG